MEDAQQVGENVLKDALKNLALNDIYNLQETVLFYNLGPRASMSEEEIDKMKNKENCITVALICNASGSDLRKPIVISQEKNIKLSEHIDFFNNGTARMESSIFQNVVSALDADLRSQGQRCLLLCNSQPSHLKSGLNLTNLELHFLQSDISSVQSVNAGITQAFKAKYRQILLKYYLSCVQDGKPQLVDLHTALQFVVQAWKEITSSMITNYWKKTGMLPALDNSTSSDEDQTMMTELGNLIKQLEPSVDIKAENYVNVDTGISTEADSK